MTLDPSLIPEDTVLAACILTRDETLEKDAAAFLAGHRFRPAPLRAAASIPAPGSRGAAIFRDTGSFDIAGTLSQGDAQSLCREFCKKFSYAEPVFTLDETGSGTGTALRQWKGGTVVNVSVTFTVSDGTVTAVSGSLLPDTGIDSSEGQPLLSAFAALTAFQQMRHESSFVVSAITGISLCYELQSTAAAPMTLMPSWQIATDTASFYVNCASGTVRPGVKWNPLHILQESFAFSGRVCYTDGEHNEAAMSAFFPGCMKCRPGGQISSGTWLSSPQKNT